MYRDPSCYIADLEIMTGKSNRQARRYMAKIRKFYGLTARQKPTMQQVKEYLTESK